MRLSSILSTAAFGIALVLGFSGYASAETQKPITCPVIDVKPADGGYKTVSFRRSKAFNSEGNRATSMMIQSSLPVDVARSDAGLDDPKIIEVLDCTKVNTVGFPTGYKLKVVQDPDWDFTELVLPETLTVGTKFQACWEDRGKKVCGSGAFESFDKGITLQPVAGVDPAAKLRSSAKF